MVCLKQTTILQLWEQPTNWLSMLDLFVGLVLKGLIKAIKWCVLQWTNIIQYSLKLTVLKASNFENFAVLFFLSTFNISRVQNTSFNPSRPEDFQKVVLREKSTEVFIFTLLWGTSKGFMKTKAIIKPFEAPQRSLKIKI